uniref:MADF domain-containing protein n=1 Tax=Ditylenchus dipsaci TaxID=166011 RepID=A0A915D6B2_9BILA
MYNFRKNVSGDDLKAEEELESKLIDIVFLYPILWDMGHSEYKKQVLKGAVWEKIGKELGKSKDEVAVIWKKLRKYYRTQKDKKCCNAPGKMVHYDRMNFLDASLDVRESHSSTLDTVSSGIGNFDIVERDEIEVESDELSESQKSHSSAKKQKKRMDAETPVLPKKKLKPVDSLDATIKSLASSLVAQRPVSALALLVDETIKKLEDTGNRKVIREFKNGINKEIEMAYDFLDDL